MLRLDENRVDFVFLALLMCDCCSEIADIFHSSCIGFQNMKKNNVYQTNVL